ncbi:protein translocase subunit SecF [Sediminicurvatus halobius]|uniref:Protein-export membrane protein SecF n=1 Tax=Sediminicurvatus halobius TaxID=2182432 RepID=A0A2U2N4R7_9GAMM|nr:protein translocase subunit SecF [Spiribacter halobius]PWG64047.1 protein translocase subunit SecF [Spiribacter halobius]UEX76898.1 protein translocase subunit SecF [Spiribacter halobius]
MDFFKRETHIDFMGARRTAAIVTGVVLVLALAALLLRGLELGLDFTGGTLVEVGYPEAVDLAEVRATLEEGGFESAVVQTFGNARDILIRLSPEAGDSDAVSNRVLALLQDETSGAELRRVEFVGPQVGEELAEQGGLAVLYALGGILIYVAFRFEYRFAVGAVAALVHDVVVTIGVFAALGLTFDLTVLAALLAVIGYSLNDTIVVFDRIRENFIRVRKGTAAEVANLSINQTLSRTLVTGLTTLLVLLALYFLGGELIAGFALALIIGVLVGTYSSIYVASAAALALGVSKEDLIPPKKEGEELEEEVP